MVFVMKTCLSEIFTIKFEIPAGYLDLPSITGDCPSDPTLFLSPHTHAQGTSFPLSKKDRNVNQSFSLTSAVLFEMLSSSFGGKDTFGRMWPLHCIDQ
jgi:hypothetical protein